MRKILDSAESLIPPNPTLRSLREAAAGCKSCPLWENATQTVFGEGPQGATIMLIGEQPGNDEDLEGHPFVGPAGKLLDEALAEAGIDRGRVYVTNVVKHFKWQRQGKRRIHEKPKEREIQACKPWLDAEIATVKPHLIVALGATAAQALFGKQFRVTRQRGELIHSALARFVMATIHPSAILRAPDDETRRSERQRFVEDLRKAARLLARDNSS